MTCKLNLSRVWRPLINVTGVLVSRGQYGGKRMAHGDRGRDQSCAAKSQGAPEAARSWKDPLAEASEGAALPVF